MTTVYIEIIKIYKIGCRYNDSRNATDEIGRAVFRNYLNHVLTEIDIAWIANRLLGTVRIFIDNKYYKLYVFK